MSFLETADLRVHYSLTGPADAPVAVFSNSLGSDLTMWEPQVPVFEKQFRVLRYDSRGHGQTSVPPGPYSIEQLGGDVLGVLDALQVAQAHFCGLSIGGMVGIWLGLHAARRFHSLVLCDTAARIGTIETWDARIEQIRQAGIPVISKAVVERWLSPDFRERHPETVLDMRRMLEETPVEGYLGCCAALRDADFRQDISSIRLPTLIIAGTRDLATTTTEGRFLAAKIPGARYAELGAAHISNRETPEQFNAELLRFWTP
jgi:3-oxoadipate enol-lactonase